MDRQTDRPIGRTVGLSYRDARTHQKRFPGLSMAFLSFHSLKHIDYPCATTDGQTDQPTDGQTEELTNRWTNRPIDRPSYRDVLMILKMRKIIILIKQMQLRNHSIMPSMHEDTSLAEWAMFFIFIVFRCVCRSIRPLVRNAFIKMYEIAS